MNQNSKFSVRDICYAGLFAAVIAVMAQISIPMPLGVPMTMQTFAITLAAVVLGSKLSAIATLVYLLLGAVGVPVLASFSGGIDKFVGPTGGFLISFPIMAYIIGLGVEHRDAFKGAFPVAVVVGTVVNYIVGVILFVIVAHSTVSVAVSDCVLPFIPTAIITVRGFGKLIKFPTAILLGIIVVCSLLGVYLPRSNMFDVWMALLIGVIAFLMRFADFPVAPFLIGYVLSAQLEYRLGQAVIYKGDMPLTEYLFSAPVALVLFAVSACLLLAPMLRPLWAGRRK